LTKAKTHFLRDLKVLGDKFGATRPNEPLNYKFGIETT